MKSKEIKNEQIKLRCTCGSQVIITQILGSGLEGLLRGEVIESNSPHYPVGHTSSYWSDKSPQAGWTVERI